MKARSWPATATVALMAAVVLGPSAQVQRRHVTEPAKQIPITYEADVIVAGGGVSGVFAAIAAARQGAKTLLIDRYSVIGGTAGPGLNTGGGEQAPGPVAASPSGYREIWIYPEIAGIPKEFAHRLTTLSSYRFPGTRDRNRTGLSHATSYLLTRMLKEAGVQVLLSAMVTDPIMEGDTIKGVFVEHKSGREAITAKVVIDATGEADVARRAGAPILHPKESYRALDSHAPNGIGQFIYLTGIDWDKYERAIKLKGPDIEGTFTPLDIDGIAQIVASKASRRGTALIAMGNLAAVKVQLVRPHAKVDAGNGWHWSKIHEAMRLYSFDLMMHLRKNVPGCENIDLVSLGEMGARGGPVIEGEYTMTMDDAMAGKRFDDVMYLYGEARVLKKSCEVDKNCVWPDVPYRVMVPKKIDGLLAVGRSASGIPDTLLRNRTAVQHMGEVGGIAAAMAAKQGIAPRRLDVKALQRTLLEKGYYLGDERRLAALGLAAHAADPAQPPQGARGGLSLAPVSPGPGVTARDYLRGFTDEELAAARKALPPRADPPVGPPIPRQVKVTGHVFVDANRNGKVDGGEQRLGDVTVSDGERVTRTGRDGAFSFSFPIAAEAHHRFVFATRPTGYASTNSFFVRIPFDEAGTEYVAAFGFVEDKNARRDTFSFVTTSDTQFSEPEWMIPTAKDYAQMTGGPEPPAFLVTAGDLTDGGSHYHWDMYDFIRGASKVPVYDGFGGHDGSLGRGQESTRNYEARIGPAHYAFDYGGVHFVHLITELNYLQPEARKRQEAWLAADFKALPSGTPVIAISHYPLPIDWFDRRKAEGVRMIGQISGHYHIVMAGSRNGVPVMSSSPVRPDWAAYGRPYRRVFVSPQGVTSDVRIAGQYQRLEVLAPGPSAVRGAQPLVVLAYDSVDTVKNVTARITSPKGVAQSIDLTRQGGWSWHGRFAPPDAGQWRIELHATDTTGKVWQRTQAITVRNTRMAAAEPTADFPWILAGEPARRVTQGPEGALYPLWVTHTGSVHVRHASPVVAGGRVYVAITNPNAGNPGSGVLCLDARSGKEVWRAATPMGDIPGPVTVHNGRVYALTGQGWVAAFDAASGKPLWQTPLTERYRLGRPLSTNYTSPVPTERGLLISEPTVAPMGEPNTAPILLNYETGQMLQLEGRKSVERYVPHITAYGGIAYATQRLFRYARSVATWKTLWESDDEIRHTSAAVLADGKLFYTGCCRISNLKPPPRVPGTRPVRPPVGTVDPERTNLVRAVDAASGKLLWETPLRNPAINDVEQANATPAAWDDLLVVNGAEPVGLDAASGKERWSLKYVQDPERYERSQRQVLGGSSGPLIAGSRAFFGHDDTSLRAVDKAGRVDWEYRMGTPVNTSPASSGNLLFVHDYVGNLWCFAPGRPADAVAERDQR